MNFLAFLTAIAGSIVNTRLESLFVSKIFISIILIIVGFLVRNPFISVILTLFLLFSRTLYSPMKSDAIKDLKNYLFNKILLGSPTYLMLIFTGGVFLGFALPAVKNYWLSISIFVILTNLLIYLVEFSNFKSFNEKIEKYMETHDPIESLKEAYQRMMPFKEVNAEEIIKIRMEQLRNYKERHEKYNKK